MGSKRVTDPTGEDQGPNRKAHKPEGKRMIFHTYESLGGKKKANPTVETPSRFYPRLNQDRPSCRLVGFGLAVTVVRKTVGSALALQENQISEEQTPRR